MPTVWIDPAGPAPGFYAELVEFSPGSPPDRPHPQPPLGIWGPGSPIIGNPITGIPGYPPPIGPPIGGQLPPPPLTAANALVIPLPPDTPPDPVPPGIPAGSTQMLVWFGPGTKPAMAWVGPFVSTGPVAPPPASTLPA